MNPLAYFSLIFYIKTSLITSWCTVHGARCTAAFDADGDSLILLSVMKLALLHYLTHQDSPLNRFIIVWILLLDAHFVVTITSTLSNKFETIVHLVGFFIIRIYHDAQSSECQIYRRCPQNWWSF